MRARHPRSRTVGLARPRARALRTRVTPSHARADGSITTPYATRRGHPLDLALRARSLLARSRTDARRHLPLKTKVRAREPPPYRAVRERSYCWITDRIPNIFVADVRSGSPPAAEYRAVRYSHRTRAGSGARDSAAQRRLAAASDACISSRSASSSDRVPQPNRASRARLRAISGPHSIDRWGPSELFASCGVLPRLSIASALASILPPSGQHDGDRAFAAVVGSGTCLVFDAATRPPSYGQGATRVRRLRRARSLLTTHDLPRRSRRSRTAQPNRTDGRPLRRSLSAARARRDPKFLVLKRGSQLQSSIRALSAALLMVASRMPTQKRFAGTARRARPRSRAVDTDPRSPLCTDYRPHRCLARAGYWRSRR